MGMYFFDWAVDLAKVPIDPKERGTGWAMLMAMVRQDHEKGLVKAWGGFIGELNGFVVYEGEEVEVLNAIQQYIPFCTFKAKPVASEDQINSMIKALTG